MKKNKRYLNSLLLILILNFVAFYSFIASAESTIPPSGATPTSYEVRPGHLGRTIGDIGWAIQTHAENQGCSVVREFVGHGVGFDFHEPPQIPHYGRQGEGVRLVPGMVFTIEPMINLGGRELVVLEDRWTAVTKDQSLSAQFEQTLVVTQTGFESLTPYPL